MEAAQFAVVVGGLCCTKWGVISTLLYQQTVEKISIIEMTLMTCADFNPAKDALIGACGLVLGRALDLLNAQNSVANLK